MKKKLLPRRTLQLCFIALVNRRKKKEPFLYRVFCQFFVQREIRNSFREKQPEEKLFRHDYFGTISDRSLIPLAAVEFNRLSVTDVGMNT